MIGQDRISALRVHRLRIPARATHSHGSGDVAAVDTVILELTTEGGLTGFGEASPWPVFTGTAEAAAAALHVHLRPLLIGADPVLIEPLMAAADRSLVGHPEAKAAVETALLDITGRLFGCPVAELLGGRQRDTIPLSFSVANPDFDADLDDVAALWADGVRLLKLKTGFADHQFDLMRLERLRTTYGAELDLRIDYNQGMRPYEAIRRLRDVEAFRPTFIEQPVPADCLGAMAAIAAALDTPLLADESVFDAPAALIAVEHRVADAISLKIMKSGGLRAALEVAAIARAAGLEVYGGCMFETGIAHAAGAHLMATVRDLRLGCEFYMATYYLEADVLQDPFPVRDGRVHVPTGPGLGVEIDRDRLGHYAVEVLG